MKIDIREIPSYVINVESDTKRYTTSSRLLKLLGFENVHYVKAVEDRICGCSKSHHKVLSDSSIPTPFIVFEDDIILNDIPDYIIDIPDDADALYLGASEWGTFLNHCSGGIVHYDRVDDRIVKVHNMLATHAIMYITPTYRNLVANISYRCGYHWPSVLGGSLDIAFAEIQKYFNVYALDTPLFKQSGYNEVVTGSTISKVGISKEESMDFFNTYTKTPSKLTTIPDSAGVHGGYTPIPLHQQNAKT